MDFLYYVEKEGFISPLFNNWKDANAKAIEFSKDSDHKRVSLIRYHPTKNGWDWDGTDVVVY